MISSRNKFNRRLARIFETPEEPVDVVSASVLKAMSFIKEDPAQAHAPKRLPNFHPGLDD